MSTVSGIEYRELWRAAEIAKLEVEPFDARAGNCVLRSKQAGGEWEDMTAAVIASIEDSLRLYRSLGS